MICGVNTKNIVHPRQIWECEKYEDCTTSGKARSFHFCNSLVQDQTGQRLFSCFQISFSFLQNLGFPIKSNQIVFQRNAKLNPLREGLINIILFFKTQSYEILYKISSSSSPTSLSWLSSSFRMIKSGPGSFRGYLNIQRPPAEKLNFCAVRKCPKCCQWTLCLKRN